MNKAYLLHQEHYATAGRYRRRSPLNIEATPVCSHSAFESEYKTKNRDVKQSTRRDNRSDVEKLAKSAEEAAFVGDLGEEDKITKELVNANTNADPSVLCLNGNIFSTEEEKLNGWREHNESVLNHVVSSDVPAFAPTTEPKLEAYHKLLPINWK